MSRPESFLSSAEYLHCVVVVPGGTDMLYTDCYFTFKGRHFYSRCRGHVDPARFEVEKQSFLSLANQAKHEIELLVPRDWPRHIQTLAENAALSKQYRQRMTNMRRMLVRVKTAAISVMTRNAEIPAQSDVALAQKINQLTNDIGESK